MWGHWFSMFKGYGIFLTRSSPLGAIYILCTLLRNPLGIGNTIRMEKVGNPLPLEYFLQCTKDNGNMRVNPRKEYLFSDALLYISCSTGVFCPAAFANTILIQCMHAYTWDSQSSVSCIIENMKFIILPQDITFISPSSPFATSSSASYIRFAAIMADINV